MTALPEVGTAGLRPPRPMESRHDLLRHLRRDIEANVERTLTAKQLPGALLRSRGSQAMLLTRLGQWASDSGFSLVAELLQRWTQFLFHVDISPEARIGPGLKLRHCHGVVVGSEARLGENVTLLQNVTIGKRFSGGPGRPDGMATVGDDVTIGAGAVLLGPVNVGPKAMIGANAVLSDDVPECGTVIAPRPAIKAPEPRSVSEATRDHGADDSTL